MSQELTFKGTIIEIKSVQQVSEKFKKQEIVISDKESQYPQTVQFELQQDKCDLIKNFKIGDITDVSFNLRGRQWPDPKTGEVKTFNTLAIWRMSKVGGEPQINNSEPQSNSNDSDSLPF